MTMNTSRADVTQAVMEDAAFAIRDSVETAKTRGITLTRSKICGGAMLVPGACGAYASVGEIAE